MIELVRGNILAPDAAAIVNAVNCVGVMGKGLTLQFKESRPENFEAYLSTFYGDPFHATANE